MFYSNIRLYLKLGVWGLKTIFGPIEPKNLPSQKSRTLVPIFKSKASFHPESTGESAALLKYENRSSPRGLESKN